VPRIQGLNERQSAFVREYLVDLNATQAAIRVGYSPRTAQEQSSRLLSNVIVAAAVEEALKTRAKRTEITADSVLRELASVAFAHMGEYATWSDDRVSLKESSEVDPRAVSEVKQTASRSGISVGIKLHDKLGALKLLGQHLGMWSDTGDSAGQTPAKAIPADEWERLP
jgi:phage terminase small subunit